MNDDHGPPPGPVESWIEGAWREALAETWQMLTGECPAAIAVSGPPPGDSAWVSRTFDAATGAAIHVGLAPAARRLLGGAILRSGGSEEYNEAEAEATCEEFLRQVLAVVARKMGDRLQREVGEVAGGNEPPPPGAETFGVRLSVAGDAAAEIHAWVSPRLQAALNVEPPPPALARAPDPGYVAEAEVAPRLPGQSIELLLDVELPVSLSFGRTHLPLRDVLRLTSGSIVELNRSVGEPVEVIVNNCVIARGDVVVVDGNYGVRITQIISRHERLRTLH